jgi:hypothetical protein
MKGVRPDGVLIARPQDDLVPDGVGVFAPGRWDRFRARGWLAGDVKIDLSPAAAEGLFFARLTGDGWMEMFGAGLARKENEFFGADAIRVDVYDQLQTGAVQLV